jgi:hypothetical protein
MMEGLLINFIIDSIPQFITTKVRGRKSWYPKERSLKDIPFLLLGLKKRFYFAPRIEEEIIRKTIKTS